MNYIMLAERTIRQLYQVACHHFCDQYGDNIGVPVGYGREVIKTFDDKIVYHHYPTATNPNNEVIILGQSDDQPEAIIDRYLHAVTKHNLEERNLQELQLALTRKPAVSH